MAGFERTEWINHSPATIFNALSDEEKAPEIMPGVTKMEKITEGPTGVGTRFRETRLINNREATAEIEVVGFEENRQYSVRSSTGGVDATYHYNLQPENEGTRIHLVCEVEASGLKKLAVPILTAVLKREDGDHLQHLKKALEKPT